VDVLIDSTKGFEKDLAKLSKEERALVVEKINSCAQLFPTQKAVVYRKLHRLHLPSLVNGYESSLYTLRISYKLRLIFAVDEDPIFEQTVFTLFRVVQHGELEKAYKSVAESLYQELFAKEREPAQMS